MADAVAAATGHARHDAVRVAEAVDRGGRLGPILAVCDQCAQLYADLVAIAGALSAAAFPVRARDYTLRPADARRIRRSRWGFPWVTPRSIADVVTRPIAIGFTTVGLVGLLATGTSVIAETDLGPTGGHEGGRAGALLDPPSVTPMNAGDASGPPSEVAGRQPQVRHPSEALAVSITLLAVGGGLFAARRIAGHGSRVR